MALSSKQQKLSDLLKRNPNTAIGQQQGQLYVAQGIPPGLIADAIIDDLISVLEKL